MAKRKKKSKHGTTPKRLVEILPYYNEQNMSHEQVADVYGVARNTVIRWVKLLRENGYEVKTKPRGLPELRID